MDGELLQRCSSGFFYSQALHNTLFIGRKKIDCLSIPLRNVSRLPSERVILPRRFHIKSVLPWLIGRNWEALSFTNVRVWNFHLGLYPSKTTWRGVPIMAQQKQIQLGTMRVQVPSLALLSGLRIRHCCEPWCRIWRSCGSGLGQQLQF